MKKAFVIIISVLIFIYVVSGCSKSSSPASSEPDSTSTLTPWFSFDAGLEDWYAENPGLMTLTYTDVTKYAGTGAIKAACIFPDASDRIVFRKDFSTAVDVENNTITFKVYVPADLAGLTVKYQSVLWYEKYSNWRTVAGPQVTTSGWSDFSFYFSGYSPMTTTVLALEIKRPATGDAWSGDLYFDHIEKK